MKILDCTLRDGGHLNNWSFSDEFAKNLYITAITTGIDYFEVGYKSSNILNQFGAFAYCDDEFLNTVFHRDNNCKITVMAQHNKFFADDFKEVGCNNNLIQAVRVATYPDTIQESFYECIELKEKGYEVFFNLMAASRFENEHYKVLEKLENKKLIDYLVFSDSFGAMLPTDVANMTQRLFLFGFDNIGFHSHNNQQLAFANSLTAISAGCSIIDATVCSIGRGAGNLSMELLLSYLYRNGSHVSPIYYLEFIDRFLPNRLDSVYNLIAGHFNLHNKYITECISRKNVSLVELWNIAEKHSLSLPIHFNEKHVI